MPLASLREHQHELVGESESDGFVFGTEDTGYLTLTRPQVVAGDVRENDTPRPQEDGVAMGRDYRGGKTYQYELGVITDRVLGFTDPGRANSDALNVFEAVWEDEVWRDTPQSYAILRSCEAGRIRRCYGRPRAFGEVAGRLTAEGYTPAVAQFSVMDGRWYDDVPRQVPFAVGLPVEDLNGLSSPLSAPFDGGNIVSVVSGDIRVEGDKPTWLVVEFVGPAINPEVTIGPITVGYVGALGVGRTLTYDPRPWRRTVLDNQDRSYAGDLTANTTMMIDARLRPGVHEVLFEAGDVTGQARVNLSWRNAHGRP